MEGLGGVGAKAGGEGEQVEVHITIIKRKVDVKNLRQFMKAGMEALGAEGEEENEEEAAAPEEPTPLTAA
jgi:hypothetical protein